MASCRKDWKKISAESSLMFPNDPVGQGTELNWTEHAEFVLADQHLMIWDY